MYSLVWIHIYFETILACVSCPGNEAINSGYIHIPCAIEKCKFFKIFVSQLLQNSLGRRTLKRKFGSLVGEVYHFEIIALALLFNPFQVLVHIACVYYYKIIVVGVFVDQQIVDCST